MSILKISWPVQWMYVSDRLAAFSNTAKPTPATDGNTGRTVDARSRHPIRRLSRRMCASERVSPPGNRDTWSRVATIAKLSAAPFTEARLVVKIAAVSGQWSHEMERVILAFMACLTLAACGLGETAVSAAAGGASEAEQAKEALSTEVRVKRQLDAAATLEAQRRLAADTSSQ
jgi:hypothetical protein